MFPAAGLGLSAQAYLLAAGSRRQPAVPAGPGFTGMFVQWHLARHGRRDKDWPVSFFMRVCYNAHIALLKTTGALSMRSEADSQLC